MNRLIIITTTWKAAQAAIMVLNSAPFVGNVKSSDGVITADISEELTGRKLELHMEIIENQIRLEDDSNMNIMVIPGLADSVEGCDCTACHQCEKEDQ